MYQTAKILSGNNLWTTPRSLFDEYDRKFHFTLDPCCMVESALCKTFFTPEQDGLKQSWQGHRVFMNPPYGRGLLDKWCCKAVEECLKGNCLIVGLLPASTGSKWWHKWIEGYATVRFLKGRVHFGGCKNSPPFDSAVVLWW